jgi:hypothetical protein
MAVNNKSSRYGEEQARRRDHHEEEEEYVVSVPGRLPRTTTMCHCLVAGDTDTVSLCAGVVVDVCRDVAAWPGRHVLEGSEQHQRYFVDLRMADRSTRRSRVRVRRPDEYDVWTRCVERRLSIVDGQKRLIIL